VGLAPAGDDGFGNADCATLPLSAVDLQAGVIDFPRPKTGIPRRCPLWPETMAALKEALPRRPTPKKDEHAGPVVITKYGDTWGKDTSETPISREVSKLLKRLGINGRTWPWRTRNGYIHRDGQDKSSRQSSFPPSAGRLRDGAC
jgi:integrase